MAPGQPQKQSLPRQPYSQLWVVDVDAGALVVDDVDVARAVGDEEVDGALRFSAVAIGVAGSVLTL